MHIVPPGLGEEGGRGISSAMISSEAVAVSRHSTYLTADSSALIRRLALHLAAGTMLAAAALTPSCYPHVVGHVCKYGHAVSFPQPLHASQQVYNRSTCDERPGRQRRTGISLASRTSCPRVNPRLTGLRHCLPATMGGGAGT